MISQLDKVQTHIESVKALRCSTTINRPNVGVLAAVTANEAEAEAEAEAEMVCRVER